MKLFWFALCILLVAVQHTSANPLDIGGWFKKAFNDTKNWVEGAAKDTKDWVEGAAKDTKDWVDGAAKDTKNWVEGAAKDTENWFKGAARDTENWFKGAARDTESWVKTAAKDVEREFNKVGKSITDFFNKVGIEVTVASILMKYKWEQFERDASTFFKNAGENMKKTFIDIKKKIEEAGVQLVKDIFQKIYQALQDAKDKLEDLSKTADAKFENAMVVVRENLFSATWQIKDFLNRMKLIIDTKKDQKRGMLILESYSKESTQMIYSCSDAAIEPIRDIYEATKSLISKTIKTLEEFLEDIRGCLDKGLTLDAAKCGKNLKKIAKEALKEIGSELLSMKATLISSAVSEVTNIVCIAETRLGVEKNKSKVETAIRNLE